jgi:hypothetical protein
MIAAEASASWLQCSTIHAILKHLYSSGRKNPEIVLGSPILSRSRSRRRQFLFRIQRKGK